MKCVAGEPRAPVWEGTLPVCEAVEDTCTGEWCAEHKLAAGDCCSASNDCLPGLECHLGHRVRPLHHLRLD